MDAVENPDTILDFWFGPYDSVAATAAAKSKLWWGKDAAMDRVIRERYEPTLKRAAEGQLDSWGDSAAGCLALILLCDQFPRNMYRELPAPLPMTPPRWSGAGAAWKGSWTVHWMR